MSDQNGITDEALRTVLAPGERALYRALGLLLPAQTWKQFTGGYFDVVCSLVVTTRRFLVLRRKVHWFSTEFTAEPVMSLEHAQVSRISSSGALGRYLLTVHRADAVRHDFTIRTAPLECEAQRAFVEEMPARFNGRQLPRE